MAVDPDTLSPSSPAASAAPGLASFTFAPELDPQARATVADAVALAARALVVTDPDEDDGALARPREAAQAVHRLGLDANAIAAALVVPAIEHGRLTVAEVDEALGPDIAGLTDGVVRMAAFGEHLHKPGAARDAEKQIDRLRKLLITLVDDVRVVLVKLADQLYITRHARDRDDAERVKVARETLDVYAPLASRLGIFQLKWELEDLAFRALEPATYASLARRLRERRTDRERYIARVVAELEQRLATTGLEAEVTGRPKHLYSIWRKMNQKGLGFDQLFDLRAVRVLVDDVAACYSALGVVHMLWTHVPREFDDYITHPKPNNYRSLHTAVIGPEGRVLEVQIRTHDMHAHAELGVAAHWRYKEADDARNRDVESKIAWLRQVLEWKDEDAAGSDLIDHLGAELLAERVYVLTPRGEILDLPAGSTPLDFAYHVHTDVGHRCRGAKINGSMVPLDRVLRSGDQVEILTTRTASPSRDWLNPNLGYLGSARSRAKVRHWFRQQDFDLNLAEGQEILNREVRRLGVPDLDRDALIERFNFTRGEEMLAAIGRGDVSTGQLTAALQLQVPRPEPAAPPARPRAARPRPAGDVQISGVGNLLTHMAQCCKPVPPEPISGFITRGRGVTIHRADCRNVLRMSTEEAARIIDVAWSEIADATYPAEIDITAYDRQGLLRDVTTLIANEKLNVLALHSRTDPDDQAVTIRIAVEISNLSELTRLMDRAGRIANVFEVRRVS